MKRKSLLFFLLMAMFAPLAMNGQQTLTVYENETSTSNYIPLYGFNGDYYQKTEFVIPASELQDMNGGEITQMKFYISGTKPTKVWGPFQVFLKEVTNTTINGWSGTNGATTVYTGNFDGTSGTVDIVFNGSTPSYTYNGGNLLVGVYLTTTNGQWNSASFYGKNVNGASGNGDNNNSLANCSFTQRNFIPRTTFTYEATQQQCPKPSGLTATNLMPNSAILNWEGEAESYNVRYRTAAFTRTIFEDGFESGLSNWTIYSEGETLDGFDGWFAYDASQFASGAQEGNHTGDVSAVSCSWASNALDADNWLVTPQVELNGTLTFWVYSYYGDKYEVKLSTAGNSINNFTTTLKSLTAATDTWTKIEIPLNGSYAGQQGYIAIHHDFSDGQWLLVDDFGIYVDEQAGQWIPNATGANISDNSHDITSLAPETEYEWQVMADCGTDGESGWSATTTFTTPSACAAPFDPNTTDITAASAKLNWTGYQDEYNVSYAKVLFYENFENGLGDWTTKREGAGTANTDWRVVNSETAFTNGPIPAHSGTMVAMSRSYSGSAYSVDNWLITPQVTLDGVLKFWVFDDGVYHEHYDVYVSTTDTDVSAFSLFYAPGNATSTWTEVTVDLSSYQGVQGYIALRHVDNDQDFLFIDDFGIYKDLQSTTSTANNVTVNGLIPMTDYMWQVQGTGCDGNGGTTDWSEYVFFTTLEGYVKHITGHTNNGGFNLIASPIGDVAPDDVTNMTTANFDLYRFNASAAPLEWENYKQEGNHYHFGLEIGRGYLYAHNTDVDLVFTGSAYNNSENRVSVPLDAFDNHEFDGWNLVGNPFAEHAHIETTQGYTLNYYTLGVDKDGHPNQYIVATPTSVEAMEGVFVYAPAAGETIIFVKGVSETKSSQLALNVNSSRSLVDRAIVRFDECRQLPKFQLNRNSTKVYIPMEGKDYAVVRGEDMGELPVNFKAENNGTYSLSLSNENVEFAYLHLIDNMTGNDVDLLKTPSYSFEAKTTDYESRFKLVYATGNNSNSDNFAYYSNGSFVINNEGNAELQVIDVMGRIMKSESINGCANVSVNGATGVYMLRLVNGDNVKVQKVVVK